MMEKRIRISEYQLIRARVLEDQGIRIALPA